MSEPRLECIISIPFAGDDLERVNVSDNLIFGYIEVNAIPREKLLDYAREGYHILYGVRDECAVIGVPFIG